jgi:hypothetical protein
MPFELLHCIFLPTDVLLVCIRVAPSQVRICTAAMHSKCCTALLVMHCLHCCNVLHWLSCRSVLPNTPLHSPLHQPCEVLDPVQACHSEQQGLAGVLQHTHSSGSLTGAVDQLLQAPTGTVWITSQLHKSWKFTSLPATSLPATAADQTTVYWLPTWSSITNFTNSAHVVAAIEPSKLSLAALSCGIRNSKQELPPPPM